jgi:hypothetical protein
VARTQASDERRRRAAGAAVVFALVAPISYVALRLYEIARSGHVDPSLILKSTHVSYLWRVAIATWWALGCAFIAYGQGAKMSPRRAGSAAVALGALVIALAFAYP